MKVSRQEYWSGLLFLPPGDLPNPEIEPASLPGKSHAIWHSQKKKKYIYIFVCEWFLFHFNRFRFILMFTENQFRNTWFHSIQPDASVKKSPFMGDRGGWEKYMWNLNRRKYVSDGLPWWPTGWESTYQCRRLEFNPWVREFPWRRKWQPTPVFLPGKSHGQRNLVSYGPWGCKRVRHDLVTKQQHQHV